MTYTIDQLKYYACSLRERFLLLQYIQEHPEVNALTYTSWSGFSKYDACLTSGSTDEKIVEIKLREFTHDKFLTTIIEPTKFYWLRNQVEEIDARVEYWNFYIKDGILEVFDFSKGRIEWVESNLKRSGKEQFESEEVDETVVIELDKTFASYYKFNKEINYDLKAINELARRIPNEKEKIQTLSLSKYNSYINRTKNENR